MAARVLSDKLPIDIAEYIARIAACIHIQTVTRSMLARQPRRPRDGAGFEHIEPWEYRSTGESFATRIESWCQTHYRPGVYVLAVTATHTDQTHTTFGDERLLVTPTSLHWTNDLLVTSNMYLRAFSQFHGPCEIRVRVRRSIALKAEA